MTIAVDWDVKNQTKQKATLFENIFTEMDIHVGKSYNGSQNLEFTQRFNP